MQKNGIAATFHYVPLHKSKMGKNFVVTDFLLLKKFIIELFAPLFSDITNKEFKKILYSLNKFMIS